MSNAAHDHGPNCDCESCGDPRSMDFLDKYLTVWIFSAMAIGVGLGYVAPSVTQPIQDLHLVEIGLVLMMYPRWRRRTTHSSVPSLATGGCSD